MRTLDAWPAIRQKTDRRRHGRTALPDCAGCGDALVNVIVRTPRVLFAQCSRCHHVQRVPTSSAAAAR